MIVPDEVLTSSRDVWIFCQPSGSEYVAVNVTVSLGLEVPLEGVIVPT